MYLRQRQDLVSLTLSQDKKKRCYFIWSKQLTGIFVRHYYSCCCILWNYSCIYKHEFILPGSKAINPDYSEAVCWWAVVGEVQLRLLETSSLCNVNQYWIAQLCIRSFPYLGIFFSFSSFIFFLHFLMFNFLYSLLYYIFNILSYDKSSHIGI